MCSTVMHSYLNNMTYLGVVNRRVQTKVCIHGPLSSNFNPSFVTFLPVVTSSSHWALAQMSGYIEIRRFCVDYDNDRTDYFAPCACVWGNNMYQQLLYRSMTFVHVERIPCTHGTTFAIMDKDVPCQITFPMAHAHRIETDSENFPMYVRCIVYL